MPTAAALLLGLGGCGGGANSAASVKAAPPDSALKDEGRALFGRSAPPRSGETDAAADWRIVLAAFRGDDQAQQASAALTEVRTLLGLPSAYAEVRGQNTVVAFGAFSDPSSAEARSELERIRALEVRGERPFAGAFLAPPFSVDEGSRPEHNLLRAKEIYGEDALYTLQVAAYGGKNMWEKPTEAELKEARKAAEEAAAILRREGELAFYYHGPSLSMVTIGAFDLADFDPQTPSYQSRRLVDAKKRFPHNLYNGAGVRETRKGHPPQIHPSRLVAIPKQ